MIIIIRERIKAHERVRIGQQFLSSSSRKTSSSSRRFIKKKEEKRRPIQTQIPISSGQGYYSKRTVKRARCRTGARTGPPLALAPPRVKGLLGCVAFGVFVKAQSHHHESSSAFVGSASARRRPFELEFSQRVGPE